MTRFDADRMARIRLMQEREALEKGLRDFVPTRPAGGYMAGLGRGIGRAAGSIGNVGTAVKTGFQEARAQGQQMNQQMRTMGADRRAEGQQQFEQARQQTQIPVPQAVGAQQAQAATGEVPVGGGGGQQLVMQQGGGGGSQIPTPTPPAPQGPDDSGNIPLPPPTPGGGPQTTPGGGGPQGGGGGPQPQQTPQQTPQQQGQQGPQSRAGQQALAAMYQAQAGAGMQQAQQKKTGGIGYNPLAVLATGGLSALGQAAYNRYKTGQNQRQGQQQMANAQRGVMMNLSADDDMMASADRIHKGMAYLQYRGVR